MNKADKTEFDSFSVIIIESVFSINIFQNVIFD